MKIRKLLRLILDSARKVIDRLRKTPFFMSDYKFIIVESQRLLGYKPNLINPEKFNEKVNWRKLFDRKPIYFILSDKFAVREFVKERAGEKYLNQILYSTRNPKSIDFDSLPDCYVIKPSHASGLVILKDKEKIINRTDTIKTCKKWLKKNHYDNAREWGYKHVLPRIIIERFLSSDGQPPMDFRFFCFDGVVKAIQLEINTYIEHKRNFYTPEWQRMPVGYNYPIHEGNIPRPDNFDQMIDVAEKISKGFDFLRVDLYNVDGRIYFSEITLYPFAGFIRFHPENFDEIFGKWWNNKTQKKTRWTTLDSISDALDYLSTFPKRFFSKIELTD